MVKACHEDLGTISSFPMFANPHVTFTMFSLCFAQRFSYLLHTMFPSLGIFQHYVEFNIHTIVIIEKLLGEIFLVVLQITFHLSSAHFFITLCTHLGLSHLIVAHLSCY